MKNSNGNNSNSNNSDNNNSHSRTTDSYSYSRVIKSQPYERPSWDGLVTFCFSEPRQGGILFWVATTAHLQGVTIYISGAMDPFPDLFAWLEDIVLDRIPAEVAIDEEGRLKILSVEPEEDDRLDFQVLDRLEVEVTAEILLRVRVPKRQLVSEFVRKFDLFIEEYYRPDHWGGYRYDIHNLVSKIIRDYLRGDERI